MRYLLFGLLLCACNSPTNVKVYENKEVNNLSYYKDNQTGLCFISSTVHSYPIGTDTIYSNVPCTPEVEKLIKK